MTITAIDIQEQVFSTARHGYDAEEVDVFLEELAYEVDNYINQINELRNQIAAAEQQLANTSQVDPGLQHRLEDAERRASDAERKVSDLERELDSTKRELSDSLARPQSDPSDQQRIQELEGVVASLKQEIADRAAQQEGTIANAIITAQKAADSLREEARNEGEKIYRESENKARELLRDAMAQKESILKEIEDLKGQRDDFKSKYHTLLHSFVSKADADFDLESAFTPVLDAKAAAQDLLHHAETVSPAPAPEPEPAPAPAPEPEPEPEPKAPIRSYYSDVMDDLDIEEID